MRVLLVTHGNLGECLLASAARIYGEAVGEVLLEQEFPYNEQSLLAQARKMDKRLDRMIHQRMGPLIRSRPSTKKNTTMAPE